GLELDGILEAARLHQLMSMIKAGRDVLLGELEATSEDGFAVAVSRVSRTLQGSRSLASVLDQGTEGATCLLNALLSKGAQLGRDLVRLTVAHGCLLVTTKRRRFVCALHRLM